MAKVMPSLAVAAIDQMFPHAAQNEKNIRLMPGQENNLHGVAELTKAIPAELLVLGSEQYSDLILSLSAIETQLKTWIARGAVGIMPTVKGGYDAVTIIRQVLIQCPDEFPPPTTTELTFVPDSHLRNSLRGDVGAANRALSNAEWKAATVLGGAAIEALLHWRLAQNPPSAVDAQSAIKALRTTGKLSRDPSSNYDDWGPHEFIEVAGELRLIRPETVKSADLARNFRNLIHPGATVREGQVCDRATAYSAIAALEHVIRDLS